VTGSSSAAALAAAPRPRMTPPTPRPRMSPPTPRPRMSPTTPRPATRDDAAPLTAKLLAGLFSGR